MRVARIIIAVLAFALIGLLPPGSPGASGSSAQAASSDTARASIAQQAQRRIGIKIVKREGKLILLGNVRPPKGPVTIQKATDCDIRKGTCDFRFYKEVPVKQGRYQARVFAPKRGSWAWRSRVGAAISEVWVTCKRLDAGRPCPTP